MAGFAIVTRASFVPAKVLEAGAGSFLLSGQQATLRRSLRVVAGAGSFAITGTTATLRKGRNLTAGVGAFALTGVAAALRSARKVVASAGAFAITGQAATLRTARRIAAAAGSYSVTGSAATLTKIAYETPAYANAGGTGNRTASITVTTDLTIAQGTINNLVDGAFSLNSTDSVLFTTQAWTGKSIGFDFGSPKRITAMRMVGQTAGFNHGTAIFRGSNDGSTWTTYGSAVTIISDAGPTEYTALSSNTTGYRYYRIEGASGNANGNVWMVEWEFKIGNQI